MKKSSMLTAFLLLTFSPLFSQTILNPLVEQSEIFRCEIAKIETDAQLTGISFIYTASADHSWVQLNKELYTNRPWE